MILPPPNRFRLPERRHVVNVFIDLCGSTAAGERLQDTRQLFEILDRWQGLAAFVVCNYGGRVGASDSDMIMGYFVGSEGDQLAVTRAVLAAIRIKERTVEFGRTVGVPLNVHVGVHGGDAEVGLIGPDVRRNFTTIGPSVNIAARLQGKADVGEVFVSRDVLSQSRLRWHSDFVGAYMLKGVSQPTECYRIRDVALDVADGAEPSESEWVLSVIESQALEEVARHADSLAFAKRAAVRHSAPAGIDPRMRLLPLELCARGHLYLRQAAQARLAIASLSDLTRQFSAHREQARAMFYSAECSAQEGKFIEAIEEFSEARRGYQRYGSARDVADCLYYAGVCHQYANQPDQAGEAFREAKAIYSAFIEEQEVDPVETGKACLEFSLLLRDEPARAIEALSKALRIFQDACQFRHLVTALLHASAVAIRMRLFTDAENYGRRALALARDFDPISGVDLAHGNIGAALENKGELAQARTHYEAALSVAAAAADEVRCEEMCARLARIDRRSGRDIS